MKTFRSYMNEAQGTHNTKGMLFVNYRDPALILSSTALERAFGQLERIIAWHVTDANGLKGINRIQGKKGSISVFTELEVGKTKLLTKGVETEGGFCIKLEGSLLVAAEMDVYSTRLEAGRRAIAVQEDDFPSLYSDMKKMQFEMYKKYSTHSVSKNARKAALDYAFLHHSLTQKQKGQFVKEWIDNCESILKKNKRAQAELRKFGRSAWSTYNESIVNQIKIIKVYVINDDPFEKFGSRYVLAKGIFNDVLEVTSSNMEEMIRKQKNK